MIRVQVTDKTPVLFGAVTPSLVSVEGGRCRMYTGSLPDAGQEAAGHIVGGGYQIIIPAGVDVWMTAEDDAGVWSVVSMLGV